MALAAGQSPFLQYILPYLLPRPAILIFVAKALRDGFGPHFWIPFALSKFRRNGKVSHGSTQLSAISHRHQRAGRTLCPHGC